MEQAHLNVVCQFFFNFFKFVYRNLVKNLGSHQISYNRQNFEPKFDTNLFLLPMKFQKNQNWWKFHQKKNPSLEASSLPFPFLIKYEGTKGRERAPNEGVFFSLPLFKFFLVFFFFLHHHCEEENDDNDDYDDDDNDR